MSVGQEVTVKVLEVNAADERVSLSIKALEERPAAVEGEEKAEKRAPRPRRQNVKKNVITNCQKLNLDSQWLTFSATLNCNSYKNLPCASFSFPPLV